MVVPKSALLILYDHEPAVSWSVVVSQVKVYIYGTLFTLSNTCSWLIYMQNAYINYMHIKVQMSPMAYNTNTDEIGRIHIQRLVSKEISTYCNSTS